MRTEISPSFVVRLYLSGPIDVARQILRREAMREGICVTVDPTHFIYTGGEEAGYVVGLVNYPRFPCEQDALLSRARNLMLTLLEETHQHSALLVGPQSSEWISRRAP